MSDWDQQPVLSRCVDDDGEGVERYPLREAEIAPGLVVRRALPGRGRRMVGPWCFLDHFGPLAIGSGGGVQVGPHPHIGLQTVTWLIQGEILHRDSLGSEQLIRPGQLNIMTAGRGIAHSEETPADHSETIEGLQMWLALPGEQSSIAPAFDHFADLPADTLDGSQVTVALGRWRGLESPARVYSQTIALEMRLVADSACVVPLDPGHEHALLPIHGDIEYDNQAIARGALYYLDRGRRQIELRASTRATAFLVGGEPFAEQPVMWWNFVAREPQTIRRAREDWESGRRFGRVTGTALGRIAAPPLKGS